MAERPWKLEAVGPLGWLELVVKFIALCATIASISQIDYENDELSGLLIAEIVFFFFVLILDVAVFVHGLFNKEVAYLLYSFLQIFVVIIFIVVMFSSYYLDVGAFIFVYCFLMILGDYIRLMLLFVNEQYSVLWLRKPILFGITFVYLVLHSIILILEVFQFVFFYPDNPR